MTQRRRRFLPLINVLLIPLFGTLLLACQDEPPRDTSPGSQGNSPATEATAQANRAVADSLDLAHQQDFEDATRGLIASPGNLKADMADGSTIWDMYAYDFVQGGSPDSVNPSLWRQATLNNIHGLFEVTDGVYQLRGFDLSNMSIIEGQRGWIVVDPLTTRETAKEAIAFARQHLGDKPVSAVIFTHSHIDHFGGVLSVLGTDSQTEIIAPAGLQRF